MKRICQSKDMIIRIFKKGGIAMNVDSSDNSEVSSR